VCWDDAKAYVAWIAKLTGKPYRLLTEAEFEYAARAGAQTVYPWGDTIGNNNANCDGCGSQWGGRQTAPVGSFAANAFGLYDMAGNVEEWTEDCYHENYKGAPTDGSAWTSGACDVRVERDGAWVFREGALRSGFRSGTSHDKRYYVLGFRVGRTLVTP
jgi:formylglycine-generating enzyme required for sulfatase activity